MAILSKEFQAAYDQRRAALSTLAEWLPHTSPGAVAANPFDTILDKLDSRNKQWPRCESMIGDWQSNYRSVQLSPSWIIPDAHLSCTAYVRASRCNVSYVRGALTCEISPTQGDGTFTVCAEFGCALVGAVECRSVICNSLTMQCYVDVVNDDASAHTPSLIAFLGVCAAMVGPLRRMLCDIAIASACHASRGSRQRPLRL
jgi:hypothetical protein